MAGTPKRLAGPAFLGLAAANIFAPPAATMADVITHVHIANVASVTARFTLYLGVTGGSTAGTELFKAKAVAPNDAFEFYCNLPMAQTDFLSGLADTATALVITVEGERSVVP